VRQNSDPSDSDRESSSSAEKAEEPDDGEYEDHDDYDQQPTYEDAPPCHAAATDRQPRTSLFTVGRPCKTRWLVGDEARMSDGARVVGNAGVPSFV
jgi:hypothetical protein